MNLSLVFSVDDVEATARDIHAGVLRFVEEMRTLGIHVGVGRSDGTVATCATCAEPWPCASSKAIAEPVS